MKTKLICLLVLCLLIFSHTAFAADWRYIGKDDNPTYGKSYIYIDKDSIAKNGDIITFWEMKIYYELYHVPVLKDDRSKKWLTKYKLLTQSREYVIMEGDSYDASDKEEFHQVFHGLPSSPVDRGSPLFKQEVGFVLQNAKEIADTGEKPDPSY